MFGRRAVLLAMVALGLVGCSYQDQRPDPTKLSKDDTGLQSKDVYAATSQMVQDLMASPDLAASPVQWTMVIGQVEDQTIDRMMPVNYDIFSNALRAAISEKGMGKIALIENKAKFHQLRDQELEGNADPYKQGGGPGTPAPAAINPDYQLNITAIDMPNRSTNFYQLTYTIFNMQTRVQVFSRTYQVKTAR